MALPTLAAPIAAAVPVKQEALAPSVTEEPSNLPRSVRGAPIELRRLIRKKQNSESARRCRLRVQQDRQREAASATPLPERVHQLTALISEMQTRLAAAEYSCATLLERALVTMQPPFAQQCAYPPVQQMPTASPEPQLQDAPVASRQTPVVVQSLELEPKQEAALVALPTGALMDDGCAQPPSPTAINMHQFFNTPEVPLKPYTGLFNDTADYEQRRQFSSDIGELELF